MIYVKYATTPFVKPIKSITSLDLYGVEPIKNGDNHKRSSCTRLHYISCRLNDNKHRQNIQRLVANKDDLEKACDCKISMKKKEKNKKKKIQKRRERESYSTWLKKM